MEKNWLIRTKSNHILGPVSKEKVQELYKNGSIKPDDEICSGNGFWFFVREEDMVGRFLVGDEVQGFNPISEAKNVLALSQKSEGQADEESNAQKDELTSVGGFSLSLLQDEPLLNEEHLHEVHPLEEVKEATPPPAPYPEEVLELKKKSRGERVTKLVVAGSTKAKQSFPPPKKQSYLKWVGLFGFLLLLVLIYFRKTIIKSLFDGEVSSTSVSIIDEVHAQEILPEKKNS